LNLSFTKAAVRDSIDDELLLDEFGFNTAQKLQAGGFERCGHLSASSAC
jgi:hypothetical protein